MVVTLYVSKNKKKMNINEALSKLYSIGPKLKSNLVTETVRFSKKYSKHVMPTKR